MPATKIEHKLEDVIDVYSGKDGKCCCGCAGEYCCAEAHQKLGGTKRSYKVDDDEVSDRMVKRVFNLVNGNSATKDLSEDQQTLVVGSRLYMVMYKRANG
jgi:hypothetical protein